MTNSNSRFRILIPCDYSEACRQALDACAKFDWKIPVEVFILTVQDPTQPGSYGQNADRQLSEWLTAFPAGIQIQRLNTNGRFVNAVLEALTRHGIDLVIAGTRGSRGWDGVFVGSHAEKIVRVSPVPVLAIQHPPRIAGTRDIVVPIDLDYDPGVLRGCLTKMRRLFSGRFHFLYVETNPAGDEQAAMELLTEYSRKLGIGHYENAVVNADEVAAGILKYAAQIGAGMIAIGTMGNPDPAHMFRPSVAADLVNHARIPVFTCPLRQREVSIPR